MATYNLLTKLTLSAAGYDKGINKAKKSTKALESGINKAGYKIKDSFKTMSHSANLMGGEMGMLTNIVSSGIGVFKAMIPAINGVKVALISSGIGAIVVAVGVAFASLSSYMKGTKDGASKLNVIWTVIKATFSAVLKRVQALGKGISALLSGDWKEAGNAFSEAFAGGLGDEIIENANKGVALAERENKLRQRKNEFILREAELQTEIARLVEISSDKELSFQKRQKATQQAIKLQNKLSSERVAIAKEERDILVETNALGNNSFEDDEKEFQLKAEVVKLEKQRLDKVRELKNRMEEINTQSDAYLKKLEKINKIDIEFNVLNDDQLLKGLDEKIVLDNIELPKMDIIDPTLMSSGLDTMASFTASMKFHLTDLAETSKATGSLIFEALNNSLLSLSDTLKQGANSFKEFASNIKNAVKNIIGTLLAESVAIMITNAIRSSANAGPLAVLLAPALAAAGAGVAKTAFNSLIPSFAQGGIVKGETLARVAEYSGARSNPEIISPLSELKKYIQPVNNMAGEVTFRLQGDQLVGVINNYNQKKKYTS